MIKARKQFARYAIASIFALLAVLLVIINTISFTMAASDADELTARLARQGGAFGQVHPAAEATAAPDVAGMDSFDYAQREGRPFRFGPMGPDSPETAFSLRHFTFSIDEDGAAECLIFQMSAVTQDEAESWALSLADEDGTGWTGWTYRYRVYERDGKTFVTVIDQGREMVSCYRILLISGIGLVTFTLLSYALLMIIGQRLFQPLEEADRKQKRFIADVEKSFKVPLTVINASTEIMERENGETEQTRIINRQVRRMAVLVRDLGSLGVFDREGLSPTPVDIASIAHAAADGCRERLDEAGITLTQKASSPVMLSGDPDALTDMFVELFENATKFAKTFTHVEISQNQGRVNISFVNDCALPDGGCDQVFDRFTRLDNAQGQPGSGLGLARVRDIVRAHNGRASAAVSGGQFTLTVSL